MGTCQEEEGYVRLWGHEAISNLPPEQLENAYALSGLFTSSAPLGIDTSIYMPQEQSGQSNTERCILHRFFEQPEKVANRFIYYELIFDGQTVVQVDFFVRIADFFPGGVPGFEELSNPVVQS